MSETPARLQFDLRKQVATARRKLNTRVDGVTINLPFVSFNVKPDDLEQSVATEILIRTGNRRVLDSRECCDHCIDNSIESIQSIRRQLEDKQVALAKAMNGPLYLILEFMLEAIRQFLTYHEKLTIQSDSRPPQIEVPSDFRRPRDIRESYFAALECLRAHLHRCLAQVGNIAGVAPPSVPENLRYDPEWELTNYTEPAE